MPSSLQNGISAAKAGQMQQALDHLKDAIIDEPQNADVWVWIAAIIDDLDKQEIFLEKALVIDPNNIPAQRGLAYLQNRKKNDSNFQGDHLSEHTKPISPFPAEQKPQPELNEARWVKLEDNDLNLIDQTPGKITENKDIGNKGGKDFQKLSAFEISLLGMVLIIFIFIGLLAASSIFGFELPLDFFNLNRPRLAALPPYAGVFLYENGTYFNIQQHIGLPDEETGIPASSVSDPVIVFWQIEADPEAFQLIYETGEYIPIEHFSGRAGADLFEPENDLQSGLYCLKQLPTSTTEDEPFYWCFTANPPLPIE